MPADDETLSERLVRAFLTKPAAQLPDTVLRAAVDRVVDTVGVGLAGARTPAAEAVARAALADAGRSGVPVWGHGVRTPARTAVLVNGTAAHALDFDDSIFGTIMHIGALVVPVALAVGEEVGATGHELLAAVACGYQVADVLGGLAPAQFQPRGFQPSAVLGVFAGVMVAARLRGLDAETTVDAFGLAGSMASGLMEFVVSGGDTKPLQLGWAAQSSLYAVDLAIAGARGPRTVLDGRFGIFQSFVDKTVPPDVTMWADHAILRVATKPYPVCHGIHDPADLWLDVAQEIRDRGLDPVSDVEHLTCLVSEFTARLTLDPLPVKRRPLSAHHARFSMPYCLARIAIDGELGLRSFRTGLLEDPAAAAFMDKIDYEVVQPGAHTDLARVGLRVRLAGGEVLERFLERARDARQDLFGPAELRDKFRQTTGGHGEPDAALAAATAIHEENDASAFFAWLGGRGHPVATDRPEPEGAAGN
ncbi:MmgE/PrpD family protein [Saccharomonospora sp. NPDC046836]|uniref:MmgE/PrpD family protein n=1 Tax=Saccharomonospora sp. NPDC046836 TaxID=3156921 RepID=UPI0033E6CC40